MNKTFKAVAGAIAALMIVVLGSLITVEAAVAAPAMELTPNTSQSEIGS